MPRLCRPLLGRQRYCWPPINYPSINSVRPASHHGPYFPALHSTQTMASGDIGGQHCPSSEGAISAREIGARQVRLSYVCLRWKMERKNAKQYGGPRVGLRCKHRRLLRLTEYAGGGDRCDAIGVLRDPRSPPLARNSAL